MLPKLNQKGIAQVILPLFLLAAIGLSVYLVQQRTNLIPFAQQQQQPPNGCERVTTSLDQREVQWEDINDNTDGAFRKSTGENEATGQKDAAKWVYPFKKVRWIWTGGWKDTSKKIWAGNSGENAQAGTQQPDGASVQWDRVNYGPAPTRWDSPSGKIYQSRKSNAPITGTDGSTIAEVLTSEGGGSIVVHSAFKTGTNYQGVPNQKTFDPTRSYAFVPKDPSAKTDCGGAGGGGGGTGTKNNGDSCDNTEGSQCKSGVCTNTKCVQGTKKGQESCTNKEECESNTCTNGKCAGGTGATGSTCDGPEDCASNRCGADKKCQARTTNNTTNNSTNNTTNRTNNTTNNTTNRTNNTTNNSTNNTTNNSTNNTTNNSTNNTTNNTTNNATTTTPVSITKAEITGFKTSFDALYARLGTEKDTGNMKVVSTIANNELTSIVSQLTQCPDDANVGTCLDSKFRTRFDFAKTAARLSAFYAVFARIPSICVKADLGINPLINATSQSGASGRVNLCNDRTGATKSWMIFVGNQFTPILSTDTRYPANPSCATLPQEVLTHYRQAETLFSTQTGFLPNTVCDGKTTVAAGGGV